MELLKDTNYYRMLPNEALVRTSYEAPTVALAQVLGERLSEMLELLDQFGKLETKADDLAGRLDDLRSVEEDLKCQIEAYRSVGAQLHAELCELAERMQREFMD